MDGFSKFYVIFHSFFRTSGYDMETDPTEYRQIGERNAILGATKTKEDTKLKSLKNEHTCTHPLVLPEVK